MNLLTDSNIINKLGEDIFSSFNIKEQYIKFFEHPFEGEESKIIGCIEKVYFYTDFYDTSSFGSFSEYNPVLLSNGQVVPEFDI